MPYKIRKKGNRWEVYNPDTGKIYGTHSTRKEAEDQVKALYTNADPSEESFVSKIRITKK